MAKFIHDCVDCVYLGSNTWGESGITRTVDYYFCNRSVLARFSDDAPDYSSGPINHLSALNEHLLTAAILAVQQGHAEFSDIEIVWIKTI